MSKESMKEIMEQLKAAKSDEERKQILESGKTALTDEELEQVSGGWGAMGPSARRVIQIDRVEGENTVIPKGPKASILEECIE